MTDALQYVREHREEHLAELNEFLRIPSISSDPEHKDDMRKTAEWMRKRLLKAGCTKAELIETKGNPLVYGEWLGAPGKPTLLAYGHYDVQPPDPLELWNTEPFEPTIRDGKLFARGASDDKGQLLIYALALEAHLKATGTCPINVKFIIEGEEEIGSESLESVLPKYKKQLACDAVAISDTAMFSKKVPSITCGLRGLSYLQIDVTGTNTDLHSGTFGGAVINPANALVQMLASLKDARGKIKVPGFYDKVEKPSLAERKDYKKLPHSDAKMKKEIGAPELYGEAGFSTLERMWTRPTLDINGIWSGFTGKGAKTVIPAEAHAKISMRLVPDQKPNEIARKVSAYLKKIAPKAVKVTVTNVHGGDGWVASPDHPALEATGRAMKKAFGKQPVFVREGGSIPIVGHFAKNLRAPCLLMGIGLHDDNLHAPNEKIDLDNFHNGTEAAVYLLEELAAPPRAKAPSKAKKAKKKAKAKKK